MDVCKRCHELNYIWTVCLYKKMSNDGDLDGILHITPDEESLSVVTSGIVCDSEGCNKVFSNCQACYLHKVQSHFREKLKRKERDGEERFHCPVPGCIYNFSSGHKYFRKSWYLKQHYLKVHAPRCHGCDKCDRKFSTKALLDAHRRICGIPLVCSCKQQFSALETLQTHVRRFGHTMAEDTAIAVRASRLRYGRKEKQPFRDSIIPEKKSVCGSVMVSTQTSPCGFTVPSSAISSACHIRLAHQPLHIIAAVALSELGGSAVKRVQCAEVGTQTDVCTVRRINRRRSSSRAHTGGHSFRQKWMLDAETQTHLVHKRPRHVKKDRPKPKRNLDISVQTGEVVQSDLINCDADEKINLSYMELLDDDLSVTPGCSCPVSSTLHAANQLSECNKLGLDMECQCTLPNKNYETSVPDTVQFCISYYGADSPVEYSEQLDCLSPSAAQVQSWSSLGTQTSPRVNMQAVNNSGFVSLLNDVSCSNSSRSLDTSTSCIQTQTASLEPFPIMGFSDLDSDQFGGSLYPSGHGSSPSATHFSSMETQTDHDVLLSEHVTKADEDSDSDIVILTNTHTQTEVELMGFPLHHTSANSSESGRSSCMSPSAVWCTSETQTYEEFSDIEQYLCSDGHTDMEDTAQSELFPELTFTDTQTQTGLDDGPLFVDIETQTARTYVGNIDKLSV